MGRVSDLDGPWAESVATACDPVFEAADVGFVRQLAWGDLDQQVVAAILWEADPQRFADRYPDSGVIESYGAAQWPDVHCIDYWLYVEHDPPRARLSVEGWNTPELRLDLDGRGAVDGPRIAAEFARILRVRAPRA